jgi:hypothetical protein
MLSVDTADFEWKEPGVATIDFEGMEEDDTNGRA